MPIYSDIANAVRELNVTYLQESTKLVLDYIKELFFDSGYKYFEDSCNINGGYTVENDIAFVKEV